jgi:hypothetical protein
MRVLPMLAYTGHFRELAACRFLIRETATAAEESDPANRYSLDRALSSPLSPRGRMKTIIRNGETSYHTPSSAFFMIRQAEARFWKAPPYDGSAQLPKMTRQSDWLPSFKRNVHVHMAQLREHVWRADSDLTGELTYLCLPGSRHYINEVVINVASPFFYDVREYVTPGHDALRGALAMRDLCYPVRDKLPFNELFSNDAFAFDLFAFLGWQQPIRVWEQRHKQDGTLERVHVINVDFISHISMIARAHEITRRPTARLTHNRFVLPPGSEMTYVKDAIEIYLNEHAKFEENVKHVRGELTHDFNGQRGLRPGTTLTSTENGNLMYNTSFIPNDCSPLHFLIRNGHHLALKFLLDAAPRYVRYAIVNREYRFNPFAERITPMAFARCFFWYGDGNGIYHYSDEVYEPVLFERAVICMWAIFEAGGHDFDVTRAEYDIQLLTYGPCPWQPCPPTDRLSVVVTPSMIARWPQLERASGVKPHKFYGFLRTDEARIRANVREREKMTQEGDDISVEYEDDLNGREFLFLWNRPFEEPTFDLHCNMDFDMRHPIC